MKEIGLIIKEMDKENILGILMTHIKELG